MTEQRAQALLAMAFLASDALEDGPPAPAMALVLDQSARVLGIEIPHALTQLDKEMPMK